MLIRIIDHFRNNPKRIDKLIAIKGLPKDWLFRESPEGFELKKPWEADIDVNIPKDIRHLCEPLYINIKYQPVERGAPGVVERRQILGIKLDYNTEPGRDLWDRIERYIEDTIPRDERVPKPVVCAKDEHSMFETYLPRRTQTGSLEFVPHEIPEIDLSRYTVAKAVIAAPVLVPPVFAPEAPAVAPAPVASAFKCDQCGQEFTTKGWFKKHVNLHKKEKVGV